MTAVTTGETFDCQWCGRPYTSPKRLENHLARCTQNPEKPFQAPTEGAGNAGKKYQELYKNLLTGVATLIGFFPGKADYSAAIMAGAEQASAAIGTYAADNVEFAKFLDVFATGAINVMIAHIPMVVALSTVYRRHVEEGHVKEAPEPAPKAEPRLVVG